MNFFFKWETFNAGYRSSEMLQFSSKHTVTNYVVVSRLHKLII